MVDKIEKKQCTGCGACSTRCPQNCIHMRYDDEGYLYPFVDASTCTGCSLCVKICPSITKAERYGITASYAAIHTDLEIRKKSASGGVFSAIAEYYLCNGGVVCGPLFDKEENFKLKHQCIDTCGALGGMRMSKYVQSELYPVLPQVKALLEAGKEVFFTGTPCQVEGLNAYLGKHYNNLLTVDFSCHGIPSPVLFDKYVSSLKQRYGPAISNLYFRAKLLGHSSSTMVVEMEDGKQYHSDALVKSYSRTFFRGLNMRPACHDCPFKTEERVSDLTLFDCWQFESLAQKKDRDAGASHIFVRTPQGAAIIQSIAHRLLMVPTNAGHIIETDGKEILKSHPPHPQKEAFCLDSNEMSYVDLIHKYIDETSIEKMVDLSRRLLVKMGVSNYLPIKHIKKWVRRKGWLRT